MFCCLNYLLLTAKLFFTWSNQFNLAYRCLITLDHEGLWRLIGLNVFTVEKGMTATWNIDLVWLEEDLFIGLVDHEGGKIIVTFLLLINYIFY
jgi:hypothetical protein